MQQDKTDEDAAGHHVGLEIQWGQMHMQWVLDWAAEQSQRNTDINFLDWRIRLNKNTAVGRNNYMREVRAAALLRESDGPDFTAEIETSLFPRRK